MTESESDERKRDAWVYTRGQELRNSPDMLRQAITEIAYGDDAETPLFVMIRACHPESVERPEDVITRWVREILDYEEKLGMWRDD